MRSHILDLRYPIPPDESDGNACSVGSKSKSMCKVDLLVNEAVDRVGVELKKRMKQVDLVPSREKIQERLSCFFTEQLSVVSETGLTGGPIGGSFACVLDRKSGDYFLAYVCGADADGYQVCDADPGLTEMTKMTVDKNDVLALPSFAPAKRTRETTHPCRSSVLALWFEKGRGWTTVFYPAKVMSVPKGSPGKYKLKFEGEPAVQAVVPEKFIVRMPVSV